MPREFEASAAYGTDLHEPIAIIGIGLKFPGGSESADDFDEFLRDGRSGIRPIPEDRWDVAAFQANGTEEKGKITPSAGGFLDRIDLFDAPFFNISPKEAAYVDPQQRMVLETAWQALEHAGVDPTPLRRGNGGVYIGATSFDYALALDSLAYEDLDGHLAAGITMFPISGRLSYFLGWRGPSVNVDTACSSSLSALHMAMQGLRLRECDIALCGGVNALHHPRIMVMFSHGQMLAADGRCKTFDESADGYARAEGCGMVVLKRLADAERDGDNVLAVVRGTAIGQDGDSAGLTVPNGPAQELVFRNALADAGLKPADIQYVEAHGTGTPLGDPIELGAISNVFAASHTKDHPLIVGSAKTNVGHMEPASGIVGVIKSVLQLRSGTIYPHLNFEEPSRRIPWDAYPVSVPTECRPWDAPVRRALVNSFGFAGTIAAAVLEQAPERAEPDAPPRRPAVPSVFTLSGKNAAGLRRQAETYRAFVDREPDIDVASLCFTAALTRAHLPHRLAGVVTDRADLVKLLDAGMAADRPAAGSGVRKIAYMFAGQGSQYAGMGARLYAQFPVFRRHVDECDRLFARHLPESVRAVMHGQAADATLLNQTGYTQPALFTLEYALAQLWMSWGVRPNVLIGHSIGEVTAATIAGLFSLADAVTLVAHRAQLMQAVQAPGGMAAISAPVATVEPLLAAHPGLALAAVNSPNQTVVSGAEAPLVELISQVRDLGHQVERLTVSHAFHSPLMVEVFDRFRSAIAGITFRRPAIPLISNLTGAVAKFSEIGTAEYWVRHIGEPVLFMAGLQAIEQRGRHAFIEIGPSTALTAMARLSLPAGDHRWIASLRRSQPDGDHALRGLAELYSAGVNVAWPAVYADQEHPKVPLPTYAFERKRYWLPAKSRTASPASAASHPLLGPEVHEDVPRDGGVREFVAHYAADQPATLNGHAVGDEPVLPAAAYVELLLALRDAVYGDTRAAIRDLRVHEPLPLSTEATVEVRTRLRPLPDGGAEVEVVAGPDLQRYATATLTGDESAAGVDERLRALASEPGAVLEVADADDIYTDLASVDRRYEGAYRLVTSASRHPDGVVTATLTGRTGTAVEHLPVEILECALHSVVALDTQSPAFTPERFGSVRLLRKPRGEHLRVVARVEAVSSEQRRADILLLDGATPVAELLDVRLVLPGAPQKRPAFLHRLNWLRQRATPGPAGRARHVVVLGGDRARLAALTATPGLRLSYPDGHNSLAVALADNSVTDLCWFWQPAEGPPSVERWHREWETNYRDLLAVVGTLLAAGTGVSARLWLVTESAQWLPGDRPGTGEQLGAATLWGFAHSLLNENPKYRTTLVDLPLGGDLAVLAEEWQALDSGEFQVAYRDGQRYVRRLLAGESTPPWDGEFELRRQDAGEPELAPVPADGAPARGQIQIRVHAVAVEQDESGEAAPVTGSGFAGTVVAAGEGATFAAGDQVMAYHVGAVRKTVTVPTFAAAAVPVGVGLDAAAGQPVPYVAAHVALVERAKVAAGERVLVRAGGGAGQAVAALAVRAGAEVIAVAGPEARPWLARAGVRHVVDPHAADLPGEVRRLTGGHGADVVVDGGQLADPGPLAEGGRHVAVERTADPVKAGELMPRIADLLDCGELPPLSTVVYSLDEAGEALAHAPAVISTVEAPSTERAPVTIRPDRVYLVTGGLGGLGLVTAARLVDLGARHLVLVSRSGQPRDEYAELLRGLGERADVRLARADLGSPSDIARVMADIRNGAVPLGGIVHAAGVAGTSLVSNLTWEAIEEQLRAQAYGGWLLHEASLDFPELELFVVYSSISAVIGGATQSHYAAAFAFLDSLVAWRTRQGMPALSMNWGVWSRVGVSARLDDNLAQGLERGGIRYFSPARALRTFERLLSAPPSQPVVGQWDWDAHVSTSPLDNALYSRLVGERTVGESGVDLSGLMAQPKQQRMEAIEKLVLASVAAALHADDPDGIDSTTKFVALGLDSLMSLEVRTRLESAFRLPLPASLTFDHPSPQQLTEFLDGQLAPGADDARGPQASG
ncbi:type I polyketide synthase [Phytohabitans houttuyneae]|uniref:Polyketide synthase n=1 Tax=Phytohabitans houttuyneae TaxID=1076126 RepID=A0A6V8KL90_9ACTN|nr:type I polyketide synthase [Phytohabitans houttuyneae]GFJ81425.1 polyketide synthase [Phytohabitans houttuyneae]